MFTAWKEALFEPLSNTSGTNYVLAVLLVITARAIAIFAVRGNRNAVNAKARGFGFLALLFYRA